METCAKMIMWFSVAFCVAVALPIDPNEIKVIDKSKAMSVVKNDNSELNSKYQNSSIFQGKNLIFSMKVC